MFYNDYDIMVVYSFVILMILLDILDETLYLKPSDDI